MVTEQAPDNPGQALRLPQFSLPAGGISPFADIVIEESQEWALASGLVAGQAEAERLRRSGIMDAGPRLTPFASLSTACLACDWTVFLIVLDDLFDDGASLGADPARARAAVLDVLRAFTGREPEGFPGLAGIASAAADLGRRFRAVPAAPDWHDRFGRHVTDHIRSKVTEAEIRADGTVLDVASYIRARRLTSAAYAYTDLAELAEQVTVPAELRGLPAWGPMLDAAADVWIGIQDICSAAKEVASGDGALNLAAVMARTARTTLQQGVDDAYQWVLRRSADLAHRREECEAALRPAGRDGAETALARYSRSLEHLLEGHLAWNSQDNPRYPQHLPAA